MLRYDQDRDASAGILRLVLQEMSRHEAPFTPLCYAVWYEYLAGINPGLSEAIDGMRDRAEPINASAIELLYEKYVSEFDVDAERLVQENAQRILNDVLRHAQEADHKAHEYDGNLERSVLKLDMDGGEAVRAVVETLRSDTHHMRSAVQTLQGHLQHSQREIVQLKNELERARIEALTDPLTGVLNRRGFELSFSRIMGDPEMQQKPMSLIMLDIDHFKTINDTHGHLFGDRVIRAIASTLKANIKGQDAVARLGGEEFCLLLPATPIAGAHTLADKIRRMIERGRIRRQDGKEEIGGITVSMGVTEFMPQETSETFVGRADQALYQSKKNGRNQVSLALQ